MGSNERKRKRFYRQAILLILAAVGIFVAAKSYEHWYARKDTVAVVFSNAGGTKTKTFHLIVAKTEAERSRGLMFKRKQDLDPDSGMLFVFPDEKPRSFWMKNTYLPLDILFLDQKLTVVHILENVPILNESKRASEKPAKYVVELHAGTASREKIAVGSKLIFFSENAF